MLRRGQAGSIGVQIKHLVPQLLVIPMHLLNDLLRAADQCRTALDRVLEGVEHLRYSLLTKRHLPGLKDRAVCRYGFLGSLGGVVSGRARSNRRVSRIAPVVRPAFPVVTDQCGVRLNGIGDIRRE